VNKPFVWSWTNAAFGLQSVPNPTGTFTNILGATSPFTNSLRRAAVFPVDFKLNPVDFFARCSPFRVSGPGSTLKRGHRTTHAAALTAAVWCSPFRVFGSQNTLKRAHHTNTEQPWRDYPVMDYGKGWDDPDS
jgi:hypothetical protein